MEVTFDIIDLLGDGPIHSFGWTIVTYIYLAERCRIGVMGVTDGISVDLSPGRKRRTSIEKS
jgi:hypothetical protein